MSGSEILITNKLESMVHKCQIWSDLSSHFECDIATNLYRRNLKVFFIDRDPMGTNIYLDDLIECSYGHMRLKKYFW